MHGLGVSSGYMLPLLRELATSSEVHAIDLPGFGRSPDPPAGVDLGVLADAVGAWLDAAGLERPVLVANSLGCLHVVEVAARGRGATGLVLVGPTVDAAARTWWQQVGRFLRDVPREPVLPLAAAVLPAYLRAAPGRLVGLFREALRDPIEERLSSVAAPVVVVRGASDPVAPAAWCRQLAAAARSGCTVAVPDAAHAAHFSHPGEVADVVRTLGR